MDSTKKLHEQLQGLVTTYQSRQLSLGSKTDLEIRWSKTGDSGEEVPQLWVRYDDEQPWSLYVYVNVDYGGFKLPSEVVTMIRDTFEPGSITDPPIGSPSWSAPRQSLQNHAIQRYALNCRWDARVTIAILMLESTVRSSISLDQIPEKYIESGFWSIDEYDGMETVHLHHETQYQYDRAESLQARINELEKALGLLQSAQLDKNQE